MDGGDEQNPVELPPEEVMSIDLSAGEPVAAEEPASKEFVVPDPDSAGSPEDEMPEEPARDEGSESVEAMLSAELLPDGLASLPEEPAAPLPEHPSFQLQFRILPDEARSALKKALELAGVSVPEKAWAAAIPVISQLTEYQAVLLLQAARALGVPADAAVVTPHQAPSEEDLALGELSAIPEAPLADGESAPSVTLPKGEKEVLLCAPDRLPGGTVRETFGLVLAHRSIARRLFREDELQTKLQKELRSVPSPTGGAPSLASSHLQVLLRELMQDLRKMALGKGANSVLGVKIEAFSESGGADPQLEQLRLVAFGTAAVVEKS